MVGFPVEVQDRMAWSTKRHSVTVLLTDKYTQAEYFAQIVISFFHRLTRGTQSSKTH
jgi:hypothetical protein